MDFNPGVILLLLQYLIYIRYYNSKTSVKNFFFFIKKKVTNLEIRKEKSN